MTVEDQEGLPGKWLPHQKLRALEIQVTMIVSSVMFMHCSINANPVFQQIIQYPGNGNTS
jgi:hypothetical protein